MHPSCKDLESPEDPARLFGEINGSVPCYPLFRLLPPVSLLEVNVPAIEVRGGFQGERATGRDEEEDPLLLMGFIASE